MKTEAEKPEDLSPNEMARLIMDLFHRTIVHHTLWFCEVEHQLGMSKALEIMNEAWQKSYPIQIKRLSEIFGFKIKDSIPEALLSKDKADLLKIMEELGKKEPMSQQLLIPVTFEATPQEALTMERADVLLRAAGFLVSELSGRSFVVSASPVDTSSGAIVPFLRDLLGRLAALPEETGDESVGVQAREALAASLACRGAITVNTKLRPEEATRLLSDLARCADPFTCPHGRPIFLTLSQLELEKRFGRRG